MFSVENTNHPFGIDIAPSTSKEGNGRENLLEDGENVEEEQQEEEEVEEEGEYAKEEMKIAEKKLPKFFSKILNGGYQNQLLLIGEGLSLLFCFFEQNLI